MHGVALRWGGTVVLAVAVALAPHGALAARMGPVPSAASRPVKGVTIEVKIAPGIAEGADLRRWIDEDARRVLEELPEDPTRRGSLRIEIGGALYEYQVTLTTTRDGEVVGTPSAWECDCSNGELLDRLRSELPGAAEGLAVEPEPVVEPEPEPVVEPVVVPVDEPKRRKLGAAGAAGVTLMVLGVSGVGAGAALMVMKKLSPNGPWVTSDTPYLSPPGAVAVGAGAGLIMTGVVLCLLRDRAGQRRRASATAIAPSMDGGRLSLTVSGRF